MLDEAGDGDLRRRQILQLGALGLAGAGLYGTTAAAAAQPSQADRPVDLVASTLAGQIRGSRFPGGVAVFKGVRYGANTGGGNRFMPPVKPQHWPGIADATAPGARSPQIVQIPSSRQALFWEDGACLGPMNEDCLMLNIWTTGLGDRKRRAVIVRLHGGDFIAGSGSDPMYGGQGIAARGDIVYITVNHRLGLLGHLDLSGIYGPRYAASGNCGMLDLVAALEWVRDNVGNFGGDPDNVTIAGEAGGASKVYALLGIPAARGLFHRAILESFHGLTLRSPTDAAERARHVLAHLGIGAGTLSDLSRLPLSRLVEAQYLVDSEKTLFPESAYSGLLHAGWGPVLDGQVFKRQVSDASAPDPIFDVPIMTGFNQQEATLFLVNDPNYLRTGMAELPSRVTALVNQDASRLVQLYRQTLPLLSAPELMVRIMTDYMFGVNSVGLANRRSGKPGSVYFYRFDWKTPALAGKLGATHNVEVPFVNNVLGDVPLVGSGRSDAQRLAEQMSAAWSAFARTGRPSAAGLPEWPAYARAKRATMVFDERSRVVSEPMPEPLYRVWDEYGTSTL